MPDLEQVKKILEMGIMVVISAVFIGSWIWDKLQLKKTLESSKQSLDNNTAALQLLTAAVGVNALGDIAKDAAAAAGAAALLAGYPAHDERLKQSVAQMCADHNDLQQLGHETLAAAEGVGRAVAATCTRDELVRVHGRLDDVGKNMATHQDVQHLGTVLQQINDKTTAIKTALAIKE